MLHVSEARQRAKDHRNGGRRGYGISLVESSAPRQSWKKY